MFYCQNMVGLILEARDLNFCNEADPQSEETVYVVYPVSKYFKIPKWLPSQDKVLTSDHMENWMNDFS